MKCRALLLLVVHLFALLFTSNSNAQTVVVKYLPLNNALMPFTTYIAPEELSVVNVAGIPVYNAPVEAANVTWTLVTDADEYQLERYEAGSQQWVQIYSGSDTSKSVNNLSLGLHQFRVIACGGGLCGNPSPSASIVLEENLDLDLDGVVDVHDLCRPSAQGAIVNQFGCVVPENRVDLDNDGVFDDSDWCVFATSTALNTNGCTPDQIDSDSDGNADYLDSYPYQNDSACMP